MSAGVLIYCFNSEQVQYHRTTNFCIELIKKNLSLPVTVVTNSATKEQIKGADSLVVIDNQKNNIRFYKDKTIPWYNLERSSAYDHSPYDTTILLDADYFVYTDNLLAYVDSEREFLLHDRVHDLTNRDSFRYETKSMIPLVWATVTIFKKTPFVRKIFDMIQHIQQHYDYFCNLYRIDFRNFRNDYAFAIALHQLNGFTKQYFMPSAMAMLPMDTQIVKIDQNGLTFKHDKYINLISNHDVHVLDKEIPFNV
jgi:hypothetical protein